MSEMQSENLVLENSAPRSTPVIKPSTPGAARAGLDDLDAQFQSQKAAGLVMSARAASRKGNKEESRRLLQQAFLIDANDCGGLELLGDVFMEEGEQEKALTIFERGLQQHPRHLAFEEKIAICHVDLDEMRRDRDRRAQILETGGIEKWLLLSAPRAFTLSALLPGAGQAYIGQIRRALMFFGVAVFTFLGWSLPLYFGLKNANADGAKGLGGGFSAALQNMSGIGSIWFWLMVACWLGVYTVAAIDAMIQAEKINDLRKQGYDVPEEDF